MQVYYKHFKDNNQLPDGLEGEGYHHSAIFDSKKTAHFINILHQHYHLNIAEQENENKILGWNEICEGYFNKDDSSENSNSY